MSVQEILVISMQLAKTEMVHLDAIVNLASVEMVFLVKISMSACPTYVTSMVLVQIPLARITAHVTVDTEEMERSALISMNV